MSRSYRLGKDKNNMSTARPGKRIMWRRLWWSTYLSRCITNKLCFKIIKVIYFRGIIRDSSSSIQRNKIRLWTKGFRTLRGNWYYPHIYVCVPISQLDTSLCSYYTNHAKIMLPKSNQITLPPDNEPKVNRYTLSNTWIKTPRSDGLWNN